ncbi:hypothetical protein AVENLUH5627_02676 [Acinetobacter venetianus]|uniref:Uncharacterized protein n=2 Tax=Acinetobacter venetianus TaxID=52133 RepID=A0A150HLG9_9GAMM|nr:hypothetical protein AVENLUH5627_02676 [Acinetobacter venetianus]
MKVKDDVVMLDIFGNDAELLALLKERETPNLLRKEMELKLVQVVEEYQALGLDIVDVSIDMNGSLIDASVTINETTNTQAETSGTENSKAE